MTYYLISPRRLVPVGAIASFGFPAVLIINYKFGPHDAFGVGDQNTRTTTKRSVPACLRWDPNEGLSQLHGELIEALNTNDHVKDFAVQWRGNQLTLTGEVQSKEVAEYIVSGAVAHISAFLSFRLRVFVWIRNVWLA
jgi:hypothetical protein